MKRLALSLLTWLFSASLVLAQNTGGNPLVPNGASGGGGGGGSVNNIAITCPVETLSPSGGTITFPNGIGEVPESSSFTPASTQCGALFDSTGGAPATLPTIGVSPGDVENPYFVIIKNADTSGNTMTIGGGGVNINYNGASSSSITLNAGQSVAIVVNAANNLWQATSTATSPLVVGPGYQATIWYAPFAPSNIGSNSGTLSASTMYCAAGWIGNINAAGGGSGTLGELALNQTTVGTSNIQLAMYSNDTTVAPSRPGSLIGATGNISNLGTGTTPATVSGGTGTVTGPGLYWFCAQQNDAVGKWRNRNGSVTDPYHEEVVGDTSASAAAGQTSAEAGVSTPSTFGTWPLSLHGSTWTNIGNTAPYIVFEFSSIP